NTQYNTTLLLNFTFQGVQFNASSRPLAFWYEKDTSGDGLTDWEKIHGWEVTTQSATGVWNSPVWVTANPNLYATNGLVNDFLEKQFALNPSTVDTAGSHMLDTWNLTFDLGSKGHPLVVPSNSNFQYWYESGNSSRDYNPNKACQYFAPPGTTCSVGKVATNLTNITGADSSAWASRVIWNHSALWTFLNLSGVQNASWLRATLGNTSTDWMLTVEGKLSWGANPLATSTPHDGIADGARVDPLYDEDLVISSLSANIFNSASKGCPDPGSGSGSYFGWAPLFYLNYTSGGTTHSELQALTGNYTRQANDTHGSSNNGVCGSLTNWQVAIPIVGTTQNQTLQARLILHYTKSGADQLWAEKFNGTGTGSKTATVSFDTVRSSTASTHCSGTGVCQFGTANTNGTLNFSLSIIPAGVKDPTYLWLPNDNGTLSNLPWGLKRYTGEQGFDLVEVDQTSGGPLSITLPYAQNSSRFYSLTLPSGLNTFIIPRGQFLYSSLGQGILLGRNLSWSGSNPPPPLLNSSADTVLSGFGSMTNPLHNLACYWQNRAINTTAGTLLCSTGETDTPWSSSENVATVATNASDGANTGGVPGNPNLESSARAGAAIQSILTLNLSSQTELVLFLASLMDNATGGINGTILPATYQVPCLGLSPVVTNALANATFNSSGLFGRPTSNWVAPPPPPCSSLWCSATNLVSGIVSLGRQFFSFVWNGAISLATFVNDHLPSWLKNLGAVFLARATSFLESAGAALLSALAAFTAWITTAIESLFTPITSPILQAVNSYSASLAVDLQNGENDGAGLRPVHPFGSSPQNDAIHFWQDFGGIGFQLTIGLATAVQIALVIVSLISLGSGLIVTIAINMLVTSAIQSSAKGAQSVAPILAGTESGGALARTAENATNATNPPTRGDTNYTFNWNTAVHDFGWVGSLITFNFGYQMIFFSLLGKQPIGDAVIGFAIGFIGLILSLYNANLHNTILTFAAVIFAIVSLYFDYRSLRTPAGRTGPVGGVNAITAGCDVFSFLLAAYDLGVVL
ncbi:MAG: hypothetical protein ACHQ2Y_04360, partial [Candidatus Lutacidiplasmatales archaeon]